MKHGNCVEGNWSTKIKIKIIKIISKQIQQWTLTNKLLFQPENTFDYYLHLKLRWKIIHIVRYKSFSLSFLQMGIKDIPISFLQRHFDTNFDEFLVFFGHIKYDYSLTISHLWWLFKLELSINAICAFSPSSLTFSCC